jgi:hypothetical protein
MISSVGTLRYSPQGLGNASKWWLVIDCDPEIGKYYRHLYYLSNFKTQKIQRPAWEAHITVVRDELPPNENNWGKLNGSKIEFYYSPLPEGDGLFLWLPVRCESALNLREELGLDRNPLYPLHLTFGNYK